MASSMQNGSVINTPFVLVWLAEVGTLRYLYAFLFLVVYAFTISLSTMIVYVTRTEETLHEPMYIFICSLVLNVMIGCSACFPKLVIDFLCKSSTISLTGCLSQAFFLQSYACTDFFIFSAMAFDRYLAVGHPLRYATLMMNTTSIKVILSLWASSLIIMAVGVFLNSKLTFCGVNIDNAFCETLSLQRLACNDVTLNTILGTVWTLSTLIACMLVIIYSYIRTIVICLKLSGEASHKATHTLVTHVVAFSTFMVGTMFLTFRYRINVGSFSPVLEVVVVMVGINTTIIVNPLIYGLRTKALRDKIGHNLKNCCSNQDKHLS